MTGPGHNSGLTVSAGQLRSIIERVERLEEEKKEVAESRRAPRALDLLPGSRAPTLRSYQKDAVASAVAAVERGKNGVIVMPTGSGKSLVIAGVAMATGARIVVLQPTKEILEQNYKKLWDFGHRDVAVYSASMNQRRRARVTFATIGTIISSVDKFADTDLVMVDECHLVNAQAGRYLEFIEKIGKPAIGLTATPYRMKASFGGAVVEAKFLHRTRPRIFDHVGYVVQNADLHRDGFLAPIEYRESDDYNPYEIALNSTGLNYDDAALAAYNRARGICQKIADTIIGNFDALRHFLVFTASIDESKQVEALLAKSGVRVDHIDGKAPKRERERILGDFTSGRTKVVTNVGVLTTGFDFPALDGIVLGRPTMSLPLYYQMVGRGVRQSPGKQRCVVFDLCGNVPRFGRPDEYVIECESAPKHRLRSGKRYLTGVNFVNGLDLEKARDRRSKAKAEAKERADQKEGVVTFGKHRGARLPDVPRGYLEWGAENLDDRNPWKTAFSAELARRAGGAPC